MNEILELQTNGRAPNEFTEVGSLGLEAWSGWITKAYHADLYWPTCFPLYDRLRRSDPEVTMVRNVYTTLARQVSIDFETPDDATDDDKRAADFMYEVFDDIEGGQNRLLEQLVSYAPFLGWAWFETPLAKRDPKWKPPGEGIEWRSQYRDGLIGIRDFAFRDHSSFERWEMDDRSGRVMGMVQQDYPNQRVIIPRNRSLHITFGDPNNPEGLSALEAVYRLERIKYGLEVVQGIGYEHTAGYASFTIEGKLDDEAQKILAKAARALLSAKEGNFITQLKDRFTADVISTPFEAATSILEAIRYYGLLKLQVFNMQWLAVATTAGTGSYGAHDDSTTMGIKGFNGMMEGNADQIDAQVVRRLLNNPVNKARFPNLTKLPKTVITPIEKVIPLSELGDFVEKIAPIVPMDKDADMIAIRRRTNFMPETLPDIEEEEGQPEAGMELSQIHAALRVLDDVAGGTLTAGAAVSLIIDAGFTPERARELVNGVIARQEPEPVDEEEPEDGDAEEQDDAEMSLAEFQRDPLSDEAREIADRMTNELGDGLRALYEEWLAETADELEDADEDRRTELLLLALMRLRGQVKAQARATLNLLARELHVDDTDLQMMEREVEDTLGYFDRVTMAALERDMFGVPPAELTETFAGRAARVALVGGILWTAFQAAKMSRLRPEQMVKWVGAEDERSCDPCLSQMAAGPRPVSQTPLPGPGVCQGFTNCRHDIVEVKQ